LEEVRPYHVKEHEVRSFEDVQRRVTKAKESSSTVTTKTDSIELSALGDLGPTIGDSAPATQVAKRGSIVDWTHSEDLRKGILWTTILQEPRFRRPWNPAMR